MYDLIERLCHTYAPSGFEEKLIALISAEVAPFADEISTDAMGNLIVYKRGTGKGKKVMLAAHTDEIGLMVTHITKEGFLRFTNIGGLSPKNFSGTRVQFGNGTLGVISAEPLDDRLRLQPIENHYIDVGATSPSDCPVRVGDTAVFFQPCQQRGRHLISKALDDRIGCAVAIATLQQLTDSPHDLYIVFSSQEEVGTRGAQTATYRIMPDIGLALDVTATGDTPKAAPMAVSLGQGPAIKVKDAGMIAHQGLVTLLSERAKQANIPYQLEVLMGGTTDARAMQISGGGVMAGCLSIPCRYVHSTSETVSLDDVEQCVALLLALLSQPIDL